jgi:biopolymer transport protein ExbD
MHASSHSSSPVQIKKARIEIITLIDIMFFMLASLMLVSFKMINNKAIG